MRRSDRTVGEAVAGKSPSVEPGIIFGRDFGMREKQGLSQGVTRRTFLAGVGGAVVLSAAGVARAASNGQAPQLAAMVKDGKLPALKDRLPENPLVVTPHEKIGT